MTVCVYGIVPGTARVAGKGMAGERLHVVRLGSLAAVTGTLTRKPSPAAATLAAYDVTMRRIAAKVTALLPARFNTLVADEEEIAMILHARQPTLARALANVRHRVQMTVRLPQDVARTLSGPRGEPDKARPTSTTGAQFLRARAAAAAAERHIPGFDPVREAVARWVRDERIEKRAGVASVYHLIPAASADAYRRSIQRAAADSGVRLMVSGPFPPYAFAGLF